MKKILISIIGVLAMGSVAFAAGENVATSKAFVDAGVAQKQDAIPANDGTTQVLTNTGVAGEIGTKNIYDSTGEYATQTDALVTAGDFNTAIQNAIDTEFECIAWRDPNDHNSDCMLVQIRGVTENVSQNLFNKDDPRILKGYWINFNNNMIGKNFYSVPKNTSSEHFISEPIAVQPNTTYTISNHKSATLYMDNPSFVYLDENFVIIDGLKNHERYTVTFTVPNDNRIKYVITPGHISKLDTMQFEQGSAATPYQPYGNIYLPNGN